MDDLDGTEGLVRGDACGTGACSGGSVLCPADKAGVVGSRALNAVIDTCNGADDDCDGTTD